MEEILDKKDELLIITRTEPNDTLEKHLEKIWLVKNIYVNILCLNRLRFNILNHTYVPKHEVVPKKEIMSRYNMKSDSQFPEISRFDPVAIVLGIRPGELCKITRSSITAIEADYYRLCI